MQRNELFDKIKASHSITAEWEKILPTGILNLLIPYSECNVIPLDYMVFPFLSAAGGCCLQSYIEIKGGWTQPQILWTLVLAPSGSRKSAALSAVSRSMRKLQKKLEEGDCLQDESVDSETENIKAYDIFEKNFTVSFILSYRTYSLFND